MNFNAYVTDETRGFYRDENIKLRLLDASKLEDFNNRCSTLKSATAWDNHWLKEVYNQGASLIIFLKKEYKVKEE